MIKDAQIILHPGGLKYNGQDSYDEVVYKIKVFITDLARIVKPKDREGFLFKDEVLFSESVCTIPVYCNKTLFDIAQDEFKGEEASLFYSFFDEQCYIKEAPWEEVIKKTCPDPNEEKCTAVVVLNNRPQVFHDEKEKRAKENEKNLNYITFDKYEIVYDRCSWLFFRRQVLGNNPGTESEFVQQCRLLFDKLHFSDNCEYSVSGFLKKIPRKLVYYLSCMNDQLKDQYCCAIEKEQGKFNVNSFLSDFSGKYGFDESGSMERDTENKKDYTFVFSTSDESSLTQEICCDAHMKIQHFDSNCKLQEAVRGEKCHGRIYFNFGDPGDLTDRIKIGSIGIHV